MSRERLSDLLAFCEARAAAADARRFRSLAFVWRTEADRVRRLLAV